MDGSESPIRRHYDHLQWVTAEDFALLDDPEPGTDLEAVKARLAQNLAEFEMVKRQYYRERGLTESP